MAEIRWIDEQGEFDRLVSELADLEAYALDTEFHRERSYFPHLALVQLAWEKNGEPGLAVVDPLALDLAPLRELLESDAVAVLHAADQDLEVLDRACHCGPRRLFDTQIAAAFLGMGFASLAKLVQALEKRTLPKGDRLTDWTRRPLDPGQLSYAASDVEFLLQMRRELCKRAEKAGTLGWIDLECERLRQKEVGPLDPEIAWWKIKGSRNLRGKQLGVAQAVAGWRETLAQKRDIPPRFVLPELALAGIVQRAPTTAGELRGVRGYDGRSGKNGAEQGILAAVAKGLEVDAKSVRRPPKGEAPGEDLGAMVALGQAMVAQISAETGIETSMLATRADIQALAWGRESGRLSSGWRAEVAGTRLQDLFSGRVGLSGNGAGGVRIAPIG